MSTQITAAIEWDEHFQTWTVDRDYLGLHHIDDDDRCVDHPAAWRVEWAADRAEAARIASWTAQIDALVTAAGSSHRRITVQHVSACSVRVSDYDSHAVLGMFEVAS
jgi:hypothetical protein